MSTIASEITDRREIRVKRAGVTTSIKLVVFDDGDHILSLETYPVGLSASIHLTREQFDQFRAMLSEETSE